MKVELIGFGYIVDMGVREGRVGFDFKIFGLRGWNDYLLRWER